MSHNRNLALDLQFAAPTHRASRLLVVAGAGGTGARLIPALIKTLTPNDRVVVFDPDVVEARNLIRQHFSPDDVGKFKAQVMEERYHQAGDRGVPVVAVTQPLTPQALHETTYYYDLSQVLLFGCTDDIAVRRDLLNEVQSYSLPIAYLDAGNETRDGQAVLAYAAYWHPGPDSLVLNTTTAQRWRINDYAYVSLSASQGFPELFTDAARSEGAEPEVSCGLRIDLQTVAVNQTAATALLNLALPFLYPGVRLRNLGVQFTTYNTMTPLRPTQILPHYHASDMIHIAHGQFQPEATP